MYVFFFVVSGHRSAQASQARQWATRLATNSPTRRRRVAARCATPNRSVSFGPSKKTVSVSCGRGSTASTVNPNGCTEKSSKTTITTPMAARRAPAARRTAAVTVAARRAATAEEKVPSSPLCQFKPPVRVMSSAFFCQFVSSVTAKWLASFLPCLDASFISSLLRSFVLNLENTSIFFSFFLISFIRGNRLLHSSCVWSYRVPQWVSYKQRVNPKMWCQLLGSCTVCWT